LNKKYLAVMRIVEIMIGNLNTGCYAVSQKNQTMPFQSRPEEGWKKYLNVANDPNVAHTLDAMKFTPEEVKELKNYINTAEELRSNNIKKEIKNRVAKIETEAQITLQRVMTEADREIKKVNEQKENDKKHRTNRPHVMTEFDTNRQIERIENKKNRQLSQIRAIADHKKEITKHSSEEIKREKIIKEAEKIYNKREKKQSRRI